MHHFPSKKISFAGGNPTANAISLFLLETKSKKEKRSAKNCGEQRGLGLTV
jgi:hypothetical protein